jgi:hypothetical protein
MNRLYETIAGFLRIRRFEHWDITQCDEERAQRGLQFDFIGWDEEAVVAELGSPTQIERPSMQWVNHGLVYDQLLARSRVVFYVVDDRIHSMSFIPKLKRCPRTARRTVGSYYSPE